MFIKSFAQEASKSSKSKELDYQSLADIVAKDEKFQFLNGIYLYYSIYRVIIYGLNSNYNEKNK